MFARSPGCEWTAAEGARRGGFPPHNCGQWMKPTLAGEARHERVIWTRRVLPKGAARHEPRRYAQRPRRHKRLLRSGLEADAANGGERPSVHRLQLGTGRESSRFRVARSRAEDEYKSFLRCVIGLHACAFRSDGVGAWIFS